MRICNFNSTYNTKYSQPTPQIRTSYPVRKQDNPNFTGMEKVIVDKMTSVFINPLRSFSSFSVEEYSQLSGFQKKLLRFRFNNLAKTEYFYKNSEIIHDAVSDSIKTGLDGLYGEGNYKVVTIGRSLSSIGKMLGYKIGERNVVNIPLSGFSRGGRTEGIDALVEDEGIYNFSKLLHRMGLDNKSVKESDKKIVLMDYCVSGSSLKNAKELFGYLYDHSPNITIANPLSFIDDPKLRHATKNALNASVFKKFSFVNKCFYLGNASSSYVKPKKADYETKLMWFKLLDDAMTGAKSDKSLLRTDNRSLLQLDY